MTALSLGAFDALYRTVNGLPGRPTVGELGVRDEDNPCEAYDGRGYDGTGDCTSDGHYECVECSKLAPNAPRFMEFGRGGRADRLRLFFRAVRRRRGAS